MWRLKLLVLFGIASFPVHGAVESGSYVFFYGQLLGCGETRYLVDYAEVPESGMIVVFDGIEIPVLGSSKEQIKKILLDRVLKETGRTPRTLSVELASATESKRIATELMKLSNFMPVCARSVEPAAPPVDLDIIRTLANAPPNKALHPTLDSARLVLPLQAICVKCG